VGSQPVSHSPHPPVVEVCEADVEGHQEQPAGAATQGHGGWVEWQQCSSQLSCRGPSGAEQDACYTTAKRVCKTRQWRQQAIRVAAPCSPTLTCAASRPAAPATPPAAAACCKRWGCEGASSTKATPCSFYERQPRSNCKAHVQSSRQ
jgi:hypothetical protein